jgi:NAD(P)-dependent dehydrogenase (short-subunit alcohol dehydrogenase family)
MKEVGASMPVKDKVVIITGGAMGVGRYVAGTFGAAGARVAIADIAPMDNVVKDLEALEAEVLPVRTDITDENTVRSMVDQVYRRWGRIDVLINDAGINPHFSMGSPRWPRFRDLDRTWFQKVLDTNLVGTFLCCKHVIPYMESLNDGHIVNFGQGNLNPPRNPDARPSFGSGTYNVSKIAIRAFTRAVADEEREFNICVVSMGPGGVITSEPRARNPWGAGGGGGIVTDASPAWAQGRGWGEVDEVGDRYVIAADAPMEFSGHQVRVMDGKLEISSD